jgi:hypothetical protein
MRSTGKDKAIEGIGKIVDFIGVGRHHCLFHHGTNRISFQNGALFFIHGSGVESCAVPVEVRELLGNTGFAKEGCGRIHGSVQTSR